MFVPTDDCISVITVADRTTHSCGVRLRFSLRLFCLMEREDRKKSNFLCFWDVKSKKNSFTAYGTKKIILSIKALRYLLRRYTNSVKAILVNTLHNILPNPVSVGLSGEEVCKTTHHPTEQHQGGWVLGLLEFSITMRLESE